MAQKIVFNYTEMVNAVNSIRSLARKYEEAADTLQASMSTAIAGWEGASKDAFEAFIVGAVKTHTRVNVPTMVDGIATLLDNNATSMKSADDQVGQKMPTSL